MKLLISLTVLLCQWSSISCDPLKLPDLPDLPDFRKTREKSSISTKLPSYNSIIDYGKSTTPATTTSSFQPIKITQEDVVQGTNSIYGSRQQLSNGGIIFAISQSQGSTSAPLISSQSQPVLMQYLSSEGTPQQAAVQYIQLLRPIMMVPAQPYLPAKPQPVESQPQTYTQSQHLTTLQPFSPPSPSVQDKQRQQQQQQQNEQNHQQQHQLHQQWNPFGHYTRQSPMASYSSQLNSYKPRPAMNQRPSYELGLNMNEYVPSASAHVAATVLAPRSSMMSSYSPYAYKPTKFQAMAQRA